MIYNISWAEIKSFISTRQVPLHFFETDEGYELAAFDSSFHVISRMKKEDPRSSEQEDFEENFKDDCNKKISPTDYEGSILYRPKYNTLGWHFEPRAVSFSTSTYKSLFNKKCSGAEISTLTDIGDAVQRFYNESNEELIKGEQETPEDFQVRLTANCSKTIIDWQPHYDAELISAMFNVKSVLGVGEKAYAWCIIAPDIPEAYGGSVPFIQGGIDLSFAAERCCVKIDGRCSKRMNYDPVYNTNKVRLAIVHTVGAKIALMILFEHYKA